MAHDIYRNGKVHVMAEEDDVLDEWLLAWPQPGSDSTVIDVYHNHHWVRDFATEEQARQWIREQGGEASN